MTSLSLMFGGGGIYDVTADERCLAAFVHITHTTIDDKYERRQFQRRRAKHDSGTNIILQAPPLPVAIGNRLRCSQLTISRGPS